MVLLHTLEILAIVILSCCLYNAYKRIAHEHDYILKLMMETFTQIRNDQKERNVLHADRIKSVELDYHDQHEEIKRLIERLDAFNEQIAGASLVKAKSLVMLSRRVKKLENKSKPAKRK